jgi:hypothetical protein
MAPADNDNQPDVSAENATETEKHLSPAAKRALKEAEERRNAERLAQMPTEYGGRGGADPSRFGDWEINGRAIDF